METLFYGVLLGIILAAAMAAFAKWLAPKIPLGNTHVSMLNISAALYILAILLFGMFVRFELSLIACTAAIFWVQVYLVYDSVSASWKYKLMLYFNCLILDIFIAGALYYSLAYKSAHSPMNI